MDDEVGSTDGLGAAVAPLGAGTVVGEAVVVAGCATDDPGVGSGDVAPEGAGVELGGSKLNWSSANAATPTTMAAARIPRPRARR